MRTMRGSKGPALGTGSEAGVSARTPAPPCKSPLQRRNPGGFPTSASPCPTAAFQNLHQHHGTSSLEVVLIATGLKASVVLPSKPSRSREVGAYLSSSLLPVARSSDVLPWATRYDRARSSHPRAWWVHGQVRHTRARGAGATASAPDKHSLHLRPLFRENLKGPKNVKVTILKKRKMMEAMYLTCRSLVNK